MESPSKVDYTFFNKFQTDFYTSIQEFEKYYNYDIKRNSVMLLTNFYKGFPHLAEEFLNLYSFAAKTIESPAILRAIQRTKFVNGFTRPRVPQYIYYKQSTKKSKFGTEDKKKPTKKVTEELIDFDIVVKSDIMNILMYDEKTYQYLKFSPAVQKLGKTILSDILIKEESKIVKTRKAPSVNEILKL